MEKSKLNYRNKIILAPMVRVGTLPMRLLALDCGADIVYTEELIDWKLLKSKRRVNTVLGTVDYIDQSDGSIIFRTCDREKKKVVLQIGTSCPKRALMVAQKIENDVAAIDINMGCPKEFSIKGGMGVALLSNPENAKNILKTLVENTKIPVSCKIRLLPTIEDTIKLVQEFEAIGINAIAIHGRTKTERPRHPVHPDQIKQVAAAVKLPVICNGGSREIERYTDILKFRESCGATSVMVARSAQWNVSIFRKFGMMPIDDVITAYLKLCIEYDNSPTNTKYCVQNMLRELQETPRGKKFLESQTLEQICDIWDLGQYCRKKQLENQAKGMQSRRDVQPNQIDETSADTKDDNEDEYNPRTKRIKLSEEIFQKNISFIRANYRTGPDLPKSLLYIHAKLISKPLPDYQTEQDDKLFRTIITFNGNKYASTYWEKNKKSAEQGAALVCLLGLGLTNEDVLVENGSILR